MSRSAEPGCRVCSLSPLRGVIAGVASVLASIGLVELLTSIGAALREGERDVLALKAIGPSPRQITTITVAATVCTTLVSVAVALGAGLPLARWLIDAQGRSSGTCGGLAQVPPASRLVLLALAGAAAVALLSAARVVRLHRADTAGACCEGRAGPGACCTEAGPPRLREGRPATA